MAESILSVYVLKRFTDGLRAQVGMDALKSVFEKAGLPTDGRILSARPIWIM